MVNFCVVNNCSSSSASRELFMFPFKDQTLLEKWLKEIPKSKFCLSFSSDDNFVCFLYSSGLYTIIPNPSYLCEDHFETKLLRENRGCKSLRPNAVPTIFDQKVINLKSSNTSSDRSQVSTCRFCLKTIEDAETRQSINHNVQSQFFSITQRKLSSSKAFSQVICETCLSSIQSAFTFRSKLISHQEYLENTLSDESDEIVESNERLVEEIKVEMEDRENILFYEEFLDPDLVDAEIEQPDPSDVKLDEVKIEVHAKKFQRKKLCSGS